MKERIDYIDTAKFFGIVALLIEHTGNWVDISSPIYDTLKLWICSYHMPLFFIIYGMVVSKKSLDNIHSFLALLNKQLKSLIVPYVLWTMIYSKGYGTNFFAGVVYGSNPALSHADTNAVLWFLPTMFLVTIIYQFILEFIEKSGEKKIPIAFTILICSLIAKFLGDIANNISVRLPWGIDIAFMGVAFAILGKYICLPILKKIMDGKFKLICVVLLAISGYANSFVNRPVSGNYWCTVMGLGVYGRSILLFIVGAMLNVCLILLISNFLRFKLFHYLGRHSLLMMAAHYIVFPYSIYVTRTIINIFQNTSIYGLLFSVINAILCICAMFVACLLSDKYCGCLNGKNK